MLTELLQWIDAELLFACVLETTPLTTDGSSAETQPVQATGRPRATSDTILLKRLVPPHLYKLAMQSGWSGMHAMSFALRHRLTELNQLFHEPSMMAGGSGEQRVPLGDEQRMADTGNRRVPLGDEQRMADTGDRRVPLGDEQRMADTGDRCVPLGDEQPVADTGDRRMAGGSNRPSHTIIDSWEQRHGADVRPIFGFSPVGIHLAQRRRGCCRAFDAYAIPHCAESGDPVFCPAHAAEAYWLEAASGSAQALMYRYYANLENFSLYGEADLQAMIGAFWRKLKIFSADELAAAIAYFGWRDGEDLRQAGSEALRRKFLQLSLLHHPDRGGQESAFVVLQEHYQRLKNFLLTG